MDTESASCVKRTYNSSVWNNKLWVVRGHLLIGSKNMFDPVCIYLHLAI